MNYEKNQELISYINHLEKRVECILIDPKSLVFEENVKMNCFYCGKYNNNWRCPPNLPEIDYPKMMGEFENGLFVLLKYNVNQENYDAVRSESSVIVHKILLASEKWLWDNNSSNALSFIGGSCKLCKNGCGKDRCNNTYMSRSPLEATGVNIVKSAKRYGIDICFPTNEKLMRIGLLLWQNEEE